MLADEFVREGGSVALIDAAEENGARVEYFEEALNAQVGGVSHVHFPDGSVAWWDFDHWRTD